MLRLLLRLVDLACSFFNLRVATRLNGYLTVRYLLPLNPLSALVRPPSEEADHSKNDGGGNARQPYSLIYCHVLSSVRPAPAPKGMPLARIFIEAYITRERFEVA